MIKDSHCLLALNKLNPHFPLFYFREEGVFLCLWKKLSLVGNLLQCLLYIFRKSQSSRLSYWKQFSAQNQSGEAKFKSFHHAHSLWTVVLEWSKHCFPYTFNVHSIVKEQHWPAASSSRGTPSWMRTSENSSRVTVHINYTNLLLMPRNKQGINIKLKATSCSW